MLRVTARAARLPLALALTVAALGACADDAPTATGPVLPSEPRAAAGDFIIVTNTSGGSGTGSLRWATSLAKAGEIIRFYPTLAGQTITLDSTAVIEEPITIEGPADKGITISGGGLVQVFAIHDTGTTTFRNVTIKGGKGGSQSGGAINGTAGRVVLENSTMWGNQALAAGAMYVRDITLINSTVTANVSTSPYSEMPVIMSDKLTLINSTVTGNSNGVSSHAFRLKNSLLAHTGTGPNCIVQGTATVTREGKNLSDDASCGDASVVLIADPQLDGLRENGGPTMTHALPPTSPAVNAGVDCSVTVDQRYRQRDATCDLGAFEFTDLTTVTLALDSKMLLDPTTGAATVTGTLQCSRDAQFDLKVELAQDQRAGRTQVQAAGATPIACTTSAQPWTIVLASSNGTFVKGSASATAATLNAGALVTPSTVSGPVQLSVGRR